MVKYYESSSLFHYTWDQVAVAYWNRYPNPQSSHVLSEDTVFREVRGHKLFSWRLLTKTNRVPKWGERFMGTRSVKIVEESVVDPKEKTLTTYTRNLGYVRVMSVIEKVVYTVSEENPKWTVAKRSAWIDSQVFGFGRAIQAFGLDRFRKNCHKMANGFNYVLTAMYPGNKHTSSTTTVTSDDGHSLANTKDSLKEAAKKATDLAKSKAGPMYASCQPSNT